MDTKRLQELAGVQLNEGSSVEQRIITALEKLVDEAAKNDGIIDTSQVIEIIDTYK